MQVYLGGRFPAVITEITDTEIVMKLSIYNGEFYQRSKRWYLAF